jgi:hypothetical protein
MILSIAGHGRRVVLMVFTAFVSLVGCTTAQATNYNLNSDWSDAANPNDVWTYREGSNALPHISSWQSSLGGWASAQPGWANSENGTNRLPFLYKSNGTETFPHDWLAGDVIVHSTDGFNGIGNGPANVLWTSPIAGLASITGSVWLGRDIGRSVDWSLLINGVAITGGSLSSGDPFNRASPFLFSAGSGGAAAINNLAVSPGNTLELLFQTLPPSGPGDFVGVNLNLSVVASAVPGDYNGNGVVDAADYTVWRDTLGSTTDLRANGDNIGASAGKIDQADFNVWKANFGMHAGSGANAAVPEPATLRLLLVEVLTMCCRRRPKVS